MAFAIKCSKSDKPLPLMDRIEREQAEEAVRLMNERHPTCTHELVED